MLKCWDWGGPMFMKHLVLYLEALVFDIRLRVGPSIREILSWILVFNVGTNVVNRDANPNLYLVPVLQFRMPFVSRGLDTFSSDLDLDSFPSNCVQGWRCSPSAAAPGLLARLRTLLAFAPRQVNLVVVRDKGSPNCKHISMMFNLGAAHMNRRGWTGGVRSCWPTSLSWWGWWWLCLSW